MQSMVAPGSQAEQVGRLLLAGIIVVTLPALPFGNYLLYPFVILTTWFHEMGHGLTALLMGQHFEQLMIYSSGSGVAESAVDPDASVFVLAAISAGGPLAPSIAGAGLIMASAHQKLWRPTLWAVAGAILASVIIYVRSPVGYAVLPLVGATLAVIAWKASPGITRFTLQFLGVIAAMSMIADFDYLFTEVAVIGGQPILSDTGQIEAALLLPHWVWATLLLAVSAVMIGASLKYALNEDRLRQRPKPPKNVLQFKRD
ncbi:M50 family metallopeptidase [Erythrobacter sp. F6033]|uniref:M50 family metallopeptidase n=1 Tax=Erythrobacter sp. F6033 TaxID=2926401 RepID=UPI001FF3C78F|nr:M50 family metallopeptidase [Erythrobacter sp. F6033]MCK0129525.1 M50 family metallopeptidase [Erythrobacter sp. F6033]